MRAVKFAGTLGSLAWTLTLAHYIYLQIPAAMAQGLGEPGGTCSEAIPCYQGCCSKEGQCGFTEKHCGDGCQHNCNATAECGQFATEGNRDCPINVCCSEFGYCGVTEGFCGDGCQPNSNGGGCGDPDRPQCSANTDALSYKRRIAYYELFHIAKGCNVREPENIVVAPFTHINLAFVNFGDDYTLVDEYGDIIDRMSFLKFTNAGLRINIAVGGWSFSDPPTQNLWSDMASSHPNRRVFINSVVQYLRNYHLDGVDLDWEYPVATERGGNPDDGANLVTLLAELREAFDKEDPGWEISITLPTSYWYLQGFDLERTQKYVNYFNMMTYDLHGMWDQDIKWTGPYLRGHTDIQQIDQGLDLLWRNNIQPENVVFGFAFYGRSFTMKDPSCYRPNGKCEFSGGGRPGSCSNTAGILTFAEVSARNHSLDVDTFYDSDTTVKYNTYEGDQWISYDDEQSYYDKKKFLTERCLSGLMVWAIDQDDGDFTALSGIFGEDIGVLQMSGGGLDDNAKEALADVLGAYTGQDCFVSPRCTDGSSKEQSPDQVCPAGFMSVETAHNPVQSPGHEHHGLCAEGWYRHICCPKSAMPKNCEWNGAPERSMFGCDGQCGPSQFKLNQDTALDARGEGSCYIGHRNLCCDSTAAISECYWTECQGLFLETELPVCPSDFTYMTYRLDKPDGKPWCSDVHRFAPHYSMKSALCCPKQQTPRSCSWTNDNFDAPGVDDNVWDWVCKPSKCPKGSVEFGSALHPATSKAELGKGGISCESVTLPSNIDPEFSFCCDPPSKFNEEWPVDPKYLWEHYYNDPADSDVVWEYSDEYEKNNKDDQRAAAGAEDGSDAYGFVMLDGPEGSIDNSFADTHTVVRRSASITNKKRSVVTTNKTQLNSVFDHSEQTLHIYCNYPQGSKECDKIFIDGAEDTIIRLPVHVGEGPFARVVSMKLSHEGYELPDHHIEHRRVKRNGNPVYEVKIDYNFHLIHPKRADEPVNIRVDYTNLLGYWDEMTNSPASRMKRGQGEEGLTKDEWKRRVGRAAARDQSKRKRSEQPVRAKTSMDSPRSRGEKRWWGVFGEWLSKLTTVTMSELGVIPLGWARTMNLFYAQSGCPGETFYADLSVDLEANFVMDATYAYYLSATFIPPSKPEAFAYFGMSPTAYLGLHLEGNARMQYDTGRKKIIDTLSYPGLAVKGIAAVGPTLDVYGKISGLITLHGEVDAGAEVAFGKAEVFWPQDDASKDKYETLVGLESDTRAPAPLSVEPVFRAGVAVDAQLSVHVTPEANVGIKIGGGKLVGGATLMDAQLSGYLRGILSFQGHGDYETDSNSFSYRFGAYLFYNIGYKATARVLEFLDWALDPREAYDSDRTIKLYEKTGTIPMSSEEVDKEERMAAAPYIDGLDAAHNATVRGSDTSLSTYHAPRLVPRAGDKNGALDPKVQIPLKCPPKSTGSVRLPELRISCAFLFPVAEVNLNDKSISRRVEGLCPPIMRIPDNKRITQLTYSGNQRRRDDRRADQCGTSFCADEEKKLNTYLDRTPKTWLKLQCDEFPWASAEQGGLFLDAGSRSQTCVPAYQNNWHGQCVSELTSDVAGNLFVAGDILTVEELMGYMQSNWAKLETDRATGDTRGDYWVPWQGKAANVWTTAGEHGAAGSKYNQKLIEYPTRQPLPDGVNNGNRNNEKQSWKFKRDYEATWLYKTVPYDNDWWDAKSYRYKKPDKYGTVSGSEEVICAINIFEQDDVYKLPFASGKIFNALCRQPNDTPSNTFEIRGSYTECYVEFAPLGGGNPMDTSKRDWVVKSVTLLDDMKAEEDPTDNANNSFGIGSSK